MRWMPGSHDTSTASSETEGGSLHVARGVVLAALLAAPFAFAGPPSEPAGLFAPKSAPEPTDKTKLHLQFHVFPEEVVRGQVDRKLTVCFLNEGGRKDLLRGGPTRTDEDRLVITLPVGALDEHLLADTGSLDCTNAPPGWQCSVDATDPDFVEVTFQPLLDSVTVEMEQTLCFDLTGVDMTDSEGLVRVFLDQLIHEERAYKPVNDMVKVYKAQESLVDIEAGTNITIAGPNNTISVEPQGSGSGLDSDSVDGLHSSDLIKVGDAAGGDLTGNYPDPELAAGAVGNAELAADAVSTDKILDGTILEADLAFDTVTQAELDAEIAAREAGDQHTGDVAGPHDDLQIEPGVVGSNEITDGSIQEVDLSFDAATQAELDTEASRLDGRIDQETTDRQDGDQHAGDVAGPHDDLQIGPGVVGSDEITDVSIQEVDLSFDTATQAELDSEEAARIGGDAGLDGRLTSLEGYDVGCPPGEALVRVDLDGVPGFECRAEPGPQGPAGPRRTSGTGRTRRTPGTGRTRRTSGTGRTRWTSGTDRARRSRRCHGSAG